jgi:hypothetical protein
MANSASRRPAMPASTPSAASREPCPDALLSAYSQWLTRQPLPDDGSGPFGSWHACQARCRWITVNAESDAVFLLCERSGNVHPCGRACTEVSIGDHQHCCSLTGRVLSADTHFSSEPSAKVVTHVRAPWK